MRKKAKCILGWAGVTESAALSGIWAYWGAFENFHEGWYSASILENLFMLVFQYMPFALVFMALALVSLRWKMTGLILHMAAGVFCIWFFSGANFSVLGLLIVIPMFMLGAMYYFGEPRPKKWAYRLILFVPLVLFLAIAVPQGVKVASRLDDGNLGLRTVKGNGVALSWAPRGPGWQDTGVTWEEARKICAFLSEDGQRVMDSEQNIWRLPTVDEAVRSMMRHGENAGGRWAAAAGKATYLLAPDKESPLWDVHSKVIYYWTADTFAQNGNAAYIIVYDGGVYTRRKADRFGYLSFRAVKDVPVP